MGTCLSITFIRSTESRNRGFCDKTRKQYSQPSAGSTFTDLANSGSQNILGKNNPESSKKPKPELATHQQLFTWHLHCTRNCNWSRDDLQYTEGCAQVMCKYYTILHMYLRATDFFKLLFIIYFWLCWVFVTSGAFALVAESGGLLSSCSARASYCGGPLVVEHGL